MAGFGRDPDEMTKVYSNFVHVLAPGEAPARTRPPLFQTSTRGMDLEYWQEFYLLGEAEALAERIRAKIEALGGVEHVILNPLDWDRETLERLAADVLPLVPPDVAARVHRAATCARRPSTTRSPRSPADRALVLAGGTDVYPARVGRPVERATSSTSRRCRACGRSAWPTASGASRRLATWTDLVRDDLPPRVRRAEGRGAGDRRASRSRTAGRSAATSCNASPAADGLPNLLALDASVELASSARRRVVPVAAFVTRQPRARSAAPTSS